MNVQKYGSIIINNQPKMIAHFQRKIHNFKMDWEISLSMTILKMLENLLVPAEPGKEWVEQKTGVPNIFHSLLTIVS